MLPMMPAGLEPPIQIPDSLRSLIDEALAEGKPWKLCKVAIALCEERGTNHQCDEEVWRLIAQYMKLSLDGIGQTPVRDRVLFYCKKKKM